MPTRPSRLVPPILAALVAAAGPIPATAAGAAAPNAEGMVIFTTPSNNIECTFIPSGGTSVYKPPRNEAELSCDRAEPTYLHLSIGLRGPAALVRNPGERGCCAAEPVLPYGQSVRMGPFTCRSEQVGLTCKRDDGAGFFISRAKVETF